MKTPKIRLDCLLVERGLAGDRKQAQAMLLAGKILVGERPAGKAGTQVPADTEIRIRGDENPFVSRGGLKLRGAIEAFAVSVTGLVALDVGASTGGFTDCLLQAGAAKVYAVDVGYGQLSWKLREDARVVSIERTNIRLYDGAGIADPIDIAVIDASFISLRLVIPPVVRLVRKEALIIALVKPQFEAARGEVGRGGIVRDPAVHERILEEMRIFCLGIGLEVTGQCDSPLTGPAGNREFFLCLRKTTGKESAPSWV